MTLANTTLPDYEPMLAAYHEAFAAELEAMVKTLNVRDGNLVLEMACGDGAYTSWLAELAGPNGRVVGLDVSMGYLDLARAENPHQPPDALVDYVAASIERLPFADGAFDVAWCAQSLFSLSDPVVSVVRMARVVKPGGIVAVLEDDTLHQVLLPWPVEIELAIRTAEWTAFRDESQNPRKFYVGRQLVRVFREAGLVDLQVRSFASSRIAPLDDPSRTFVGLYLENLKERVAPYLDRKLQDRFLRLVEPDSPDSLLNDPDLDLTVIDHVIQGRVPAASVRDETPVTIVSV